MITSPDPDITIWGRIKPQYWSAGDTIGNKYYLFYLYCHTNAIFGNTAAGSQYYWYELFYAEVSNHGGWGIVPVLDPDTGVFFTNSRPRNTEPPWPSYWTYPPSY